jgi:GNAT superfamily N-acetyltransferase
MIVNLKFFNNKANISLYIYPDDLKSIYISNLYVNEDLRGKGISNRLLSSCESFGLKFGALKSFLWVKENSWQFDWYVRHGYNYFSNHNDINYIWLSKDLKV